MSLLLGGCGSRDAAWNAPIAHPVAVGELATSAVLVDENLHRALVLKPSADQNLAIASVPIGKRVAATITSRDRKKVFVITQGDPVRLLATDEAPALTVFDAGNPEKPVSYPLPDVLTSLAIDPEGQWVIVYSGGSTQGSFLTNPNELLFVDLTRGPDPNNPTSPNPLTRTLPSKEGGFPRRITFTPKLTFPGEAPPDPRRFLIVETDKDLLLLDMVHLDRGEVTLPVKDSHTDSRALSPEGISVYPGDAMHAPAIAVRTNADDNVLLYTLEPQSSPTTPGNNDFLAHPNFAFAGGIPTDIAFVNTKAGPKLAVIVPQPTPRGLLVNVDDNQTLTANFAAPYQRISLVTLDPTTAASGDQVLLWANGGAASVALWDLRAVPTSGQADIDTVKSVETVNLNGAVNAVIDVANPEYQNLKVLETTGSSLYVLDLKESKAAPLNSAGVVTLKLGLEHDRAWAFQPGTTNIAEVSLGNAHVQSVVIDRPVDDILELQRADGKFSLLALHDVGNTTVNDPAVTVYNAEAPSAAQSRRFTSLMLERLAQ